VLKRAEHKYGPDLEQSFGIAGTTQHQNEKKIEIPIVIALFAYLRKNFNKQVLLNSFAYFSD